MNEILVFFKIVPMAFNTFILGSFLKSPFWYSVNLFCSVSFNALHVLKFYP